MKAQVLGGSDDLENLQTAHLFCNISKHTRPDRGSTLKIVLEQPPEVRALMRRIETFVPDWPQDAPALPALSPDTIGDVFDRAEQLAHDEESSRLPTVDAAVTWALAQPFVSDTEAWTAIHEQAYGCLDEAEMRRSLAAKLPQEVPEAWFLAGFFGEGDNPANLEDDLGWDDCALALLDHIGLDGLDRFMRAAMDEYLSRRGDPLDGIQDVLSRPTDDPPGVFRGHSVKDYESVVRGLKNANRNEEAEALLLGLLDADEAGHRARISTLSPWLYEQTAVLRRKRGDIAGEVAILERYFEQVGPKEWKSGVLAQRLERALARIEKDRGAT